MPNSTIITGITLTGANTLTLTDFTGGTVSTNIGSLSSLTVTTTARVLGTTQLAATTATSLTADTISATTVSANTAVFRTATTNTLSVSKITGITVITGGTFASGTLTLRNAIGTTQAIPINSFGNITSTIFTCTSAKITSLASTPVKYLTVGVGGAISSTTLDATFKGINASTYTLILADGDSKTIIEMSSSTTNYLRVPLNTSANFNNGAQIGIVQVGTGQTIVTGVTSGVTILSANGANKLRTRYSFATLIKKSTNTWYLTGDITQ